MTRECYVRLKNSISHEDLAFRIQGGWQELRNERGIGLLKCSKPASSKS
jgi:hypothetical protein